MSLKSGTRLAEYEILAFIGAGGMGQVYQARDTKLGRDVAIKVLPEAFTQDKDRLARFEREARLLASLNHPGIAAIHGLRETETLHFLVGARAGRDSGGAHPARTYSRRRGASRLRANRGGPGGSS